MKHIHFLNKGKWDDTISSKTKPSSRALHPIEDAYFHQSHLRGKQDYGHQAVAVMLSRNGIILNYAIVMYDRSRSKGKTVQDIADELPIPPVVSYFLCDSWYTCGIKQKVCEFALHLRKTDPAVSRVTVHGRSYYVSRYEGSLNGPENAVVLLSYPKDAFHEPKVLRAFISTDETMSFEDGYAYIYRHIQKERLHFIDQCGAKHILFEEVLALEA